MKGISGVLALAGGTMLSIGVIAAVPQLAFAAHDVYPPGWNQPATNLPQPNYVFESGCGWDDYQMYPAGQTGCRAPKSRQMTYGPVIYQMNPQGKRYHRIY